MKKVLHVVSSISKANGVMSFVMNLYNNIDRSEYQFDIIYIKETTIDYHDDIEKLGGKAIFIPKPNMFSVFKFYRLVNSYLRKHSGEYTAIHLHEVLVGSIMLPLARRYGIKTRIIHSHNSMPSEKPTRAFRNNLLCMPLKRLSNVWLACSEKAGRFLYGEKDMQYVKVVNNGIDLRKYTFNPDIRQVVRESLGISRNTIVIGHVGRFCDQKNHIHLINTIAALRNKNVDFVLILVGNGPTEENVKAMVEKKDLNSWIKFLGTRSDVNQILQAMDVFVLPSLFEGLPIAGIEAQAAGLPCVFSSTITREADVTGNVNFLSLRNSYEEWADSIVNQYKAVHRCDTSEAMRNAGFDITELVDRMKTIYGWN